MGTPVAASLQGDQGSLIEDFRATLTRLERRDWWLWVIAVFMLMLLFAALAVLAVEIEQRVDLTAQQQLDIAVRGLFGLLLLFSAFVVYQQVLIKRLRQRLAVQVADMVLAKGEATPQA